MGRRALVITAASEVAFLTAIAGSITYFLAHYGASLNPEVAALLGAVVAGITAHLSASNLVASTAAAAAAAAAPAAPATK